MPAINTERRLALTDAAIAVLGRAGAHGLTHRAVDEEAGLPRGTTSNYFPSRDLLLLATLRRVVDAHREWMTQLQVPAGSGGAADVLVHVMDEAATRHRDRYVAVFELALESMRRPALAEAMEPLWNDAVASVQALHPDLPDAQVQMLNAIYNGVLFLRLVRPAMLEGARWNEVTRTALGLALPGG